MGNWREREVTGKENSRGTWGALSVAKWSWKTEWVWGVEGGMYCWLRTAEEEEEEEEEEERGGALLGLEAWARARRRVWYGVRGGSCVRNCPGAASEPAFKLWLFRFNCSITFDVFLLTEFLPGIKNFPRVLFEEGALIPFPPGFTSNDGKENF